MKIYTHVDNKTLQQKYPLLSHFEISDELMDMESVMFMINKIVTYYENSNSVIFENDGKMNHAYFLKYENDNIYEDIKQYIINIIGQDKYENNIVIIAGLGWNENLYNEYKKMGHELIRLHKEPEKTLPDSDKKNIEELNDYLESITYEEDWLCLGDKKYYKDLGYDEIRDITKETETEWITFEVFGNRLYIKSNNRTYELVPLNYVDEYDISELKTELKLNLKEDLIYKIKQNFS